MTCPPPRRHAIWVVNTHLGCHSGGEQYEQAMELGVFLRSLSPLRPTCVGASNGTIVHPLPQIILCGDFNSPPFFRSVEVIRRAGFVDTWEVGGTGRGRGGTFPSDGRIPALPPVCSFVCCSKTPLLRLDYIWFQDESRYHHVEVDEKEKPTIVDGQIGLRLRSACVVKNDLARCASDHLPIACLFDFYR